MFGFESKNTSINQLPAGIKKLVEWKYVKEGETNLDVGGGRFTKGTEYLEKRGIRNLVFDPPHFGDAHSELMLLECKEIGGAHSATILNVLNVIPSKEERIELVEKTIKHVKFGGRIIITVYSKNKDGILEKTTKGWQNNKLLKFYKDEIQDNFPDVNVVIHSKFIIIEL